MSTEIQEVQDVKKIKECPKATALELKQIMGTSRVPSVDYTVIMEHITLGGKTSAKDITVLQKLGVTHIINMAYDHTGKGNFVYVDVNEDYYAKRGFDCKYLGVRAIDTPRFKLNRYFEQAVEFIDDAKNANGHVYIHCVYGMSRSATIVIIYLMIKHKMTAAEAAAFVRKKREIFPNDGFLLQIAELEKSLFSSSISNTSQESEESYIQDIKDDENNMCNALGQVEITDVTDSEES